MKHPFNHIIQEYLIWSQFLLVKSYAINKAKKYGTLIEVNDTQTIVQWDNDTQTTIYNNFWSEK